LHTRFIGIALSVAAGMVIASAQTAPPTVDGLVSAAKVAAGTNWPGTFMRLCIPPPPAASGGRGGGRGGANAGRTSPPPKDTWYVEPAKVADNLYFLGEKAHHSWAIVGSEGIILIEALYDYMVADAVAGGMRKLGLDMNKVKYAVMSHAHGDHDGGAAFLQDSIPGVRLVYGAEDWNLVEKSTTVLAAGRSATW
jgi:metallo-beta-lactamase class B